MINIINKISQMNSGHKHEINTAFLIVSRDSSIRGRVARSRFVEGHSRQTVESYEESAKLELDRIAIK